jgi:hypothetical protein
MTIYALKNSFIFDPRVLLKHMLFKRGVVLEVFVVLVAKVGLIFHSKIIISLNLVGKSKSGKSKSGKSKSGKSKSKKRNK